MRENLKNELPYTERLKHIPLDELQGEVEKKIEDLISLGVSTSINIIIRDGVQQFGDDYDSELTDNGERLTIGAGALNAAIRHFHEDLLNDELREERILSAGSQLAFGIEQLYKRVAGNPQFPRIFYHPEEYVSDKQQP